MWGEAVIRESVLRTTRQGNRVDKVDLVDSVDGQGDAKRNVSPSGGMMSHRVHGATFATRSAAV